MKQINKYEIKYFLAIFGFLSIFYYIWYRYIRERLPRDIPFEPTIFNLVFLSSVCIIYFYTLLRIVKPKPLHPGILFILEGLRPLYRPWFALDEIIRESKFTKYYFHYIMSSIGCLLRNITNEQKNLRLYCLWYLFPRVLILSILLFDTFYWKQLKYIYMFNCLILIIFLVYYIIYCIKIVIEQYIDYLDYYFKIEIIIDNATDNNFFINVEDIVNASDLTIIEFVNLQTAAYWFDNTPYTYCCNFRERYNTDAELIVFHNPSFLEKEFYRLIPIIVVLQLFIETYDSFIEKPRDAKDSTNRNRLYLQYFKILITCLYFVCWGYIFFLTILNIQDFKFLEEFLSWLPINHDNPFI